MAEQELELIFLLVVGQLKHCSLMSGDQKFLEPIMSNSESIVQFGNNAYGKPATALNILRNNYG
jgi:hypothetical protein